MVGINDLSTSDNQFKVYPNPSDGKFVVQLTNLQSRYIGIEGLIKIYNVLGQVTYQSEIKHPKSEIDLSLNPSGIYLLQIVSDKGIWNKKIIIE